MPTGPLTLSRLTSIKRSLGLSNATANPTRAEGTIEATEVVMQRRGEADVLRLHRRRISRPAAKEVTVRVEAAGVSFAEVQMLRGRYYNQPSFPFVPGYDIVGDVIEIGSDVRHLSVGQRVAALTETGGWTDHIVLPAETVEPVPVGVDPAEAVAVVTNGVTAWQMLHRVAEVSAGQTVLVHGASGGVGTVLTQLAHLSGVRVLGTASAAKHETVRELGAIPIDYRIEDVPARVAELAPGGVDAVFDHLGGAGIVDSWRMLKPGGTLVSYGAAAGLDADGHRLKPFVPLLARLLLWNALPNGRTATFYYVQRCPKLFGEDLTRVLQLLADGDLTVHVDDRFPLAEATTALELLCSGAATGKVVLLP